MTSLGSSELKKSKYNNIKYGPKRHFYRTVMFQGEFGDTKSSRYYKSEL